MLKPIDFTTHTLATWRDIQAFGRPGWLFRGQRTPDSPLSTTLERCCDKQMMAAKKRLSFEGELIRQFRRAYHHYSTSVPDRKALLEWLSLMQHHGAPTRLLDFTYSIYIAAYFALETAETDCVVWAVNLKWGLARSERLFAKAGKKASVVVSRRWQEKDEAAVSQMLLNSPQVRALCVVNPFRLNQRLAIQRGVFLAPGDVRASFMDNLEAMPGHLAEANIVRVAIPLSMRFDALDQLFHMGVSHANLFPGLDGYARSLSVFHPAFKDPDFATAHASS